MMLIPELKKIKNIFEMILFSRFLGFGIWVYALMSFILFCVLFLAKVFGLDFAYIIR